MRGLEYIIFPRVEMHLPAAERSALAVLYEDAGDGTVDFSVLLFWDLAAIRPYLATIQDADEREGYTKEIEQSALPETSDKPPIHIDGVLGSFLALLLEEDWGAEEGDEKDLVDMGIDAITRENFPTYSKYGSDEYPAFFYAYMDAAGLPHAWYFHDTDRAMRLVAEVTTVSADFRASALECILGEVFPETSAPDVHFVGYAARYLRIAMDLAYHFPDEEDPEEDSGLPDEEAERLGFANAANGSSWD